MVTKVNAMMQRLRPLAPLVLMLVFPVLGSIYQLVNHPNDRVYSLVTQADLAIPFIKYFALPYGVWIFYIYACLVYLFFKDRNLYYRGIILYTVCAMTCYGIYLVFQTTVPRPVVTGSDPFSELVRFIYKRDQPYNCFPSIHCFSSYMVMRLFLTSKARSRMIMILVSTMSILIIASTQFVKQHVLWDAVAAIAMVEIYHLVIYVLPGAHRSREKVRQQKELQA
ncbi:phosphatase PAP2 family protein [Paenibacillus sp. VMFN-D1]|uniref:phosphatase PAP2 family protein n=1 Tax=Paenibacillus sp. VMFN-D1 TaxID=2135608 RepID=UPI000E2509DC|nr:phosphatase PAP2 family protein [Paenibacillus sp. VMFN-D1]RED31694.1 PAP2 superfamily protein [Paenibacillus sp. VMFN-D1]